MIDPKEIFALAAKRAIAVFARGSATHPISSPLHWRKLSSRDHLLHAAKHIEKVLLRTPSEEDDLACAYVRLLFAMQREQEESGAGKESANGR